MRPETRYVEDEKMRRRNKTGNYSTLSVCYLRKIWWGFLHCNSVCTDQALTLVGRSRKWLRWLSGSGSFGGSGGNHPTVSYSTIDALYQEAERS